MENWLKKYFERYRVSLFETNVNKELIKLKEMCIKAKKANSKLMLSGNGAICSIASHAANDFTKQAKVKAVCFTDSSLITAYANDYGYENWLAKAIESYYSKGDIVILISSSGSSENIVKAAIKAKELGLKVITISGFSDENQLKENGDINFWVPSKAYNIIENTHSIWITTVVDMILGKAEYDVN